MEKGKVSIVVPCYNQAEYLPEALDSVLAQLYTNWECIIVNDGSLDDTEIIVQRYLKKDNRFKYISKKNEGLAIARNTGISHSDGEFILPLDADDLIASQYLEKAVEWFTLKPETKIVYCKADLFGVVNEPWELDEFDYDRFIWDNCIFCTAMFKRIDYDKTRGYNSNMVYGLEDWDFWLSLLDRSDIVHRIDEVLFHYRKKENSRSTELSKSHFDEMLVQVYNNHPNIYDSYKQYVVLYKNRIRELSEHNHSLERTLNSRAYRVGTALLKPLYSIKRLIKAYFPN